MDKKKTKRQKTSMRFGKVQKDEAGEGICKFGSSFLKMISLVPEDSELASLVLRIYEIGKNDP